MEEIESRRGRVNKILCKGIEGESKRERKITVEEMMEELLGRKTEIGEVEERRGKEESGY
ncbi:hypothetical protein X777_00063 [Ooceraea biroi]|uniref:Uncharacterized protein n=1 Tax=Ooceraea biroi TaxID=2015173 RepID=A0A026VSA4_OOCBI|nr:hypothetical protein X777_00063 [Ooceraea biroi]